MGRQPPGGKPATLPELVGLPHYERNEGASLSPLLRNSTDRSWTKPALSQVRGGRSVRTERWRYTEWEGGTLGRELYDHASDPRELRNLAADPRQAATVTRLRTMLPAGTIEKRPPAVRYDAIRGCTYFPTPKPGVAGAPTKGGDGPVVLHGAKPSIRDEGWNPSRTGSGRGCVKRPEGHDFARNRQEWKGRFIKGNARREPNENPS